MGEDRGDGNQGPFGGVIHLRQSCGGLARAPAEMVREHVESWAPPLPGRVSFQFASGG